MAKYTDDFKLKVIEHYLSGQGLKRTSHLFGLGHSTVQNWVSLYRLHGLEGIKRRKKIKRYSVDFKLKAIEMVLKDGLSQRAVSAQLNLPTDSILVQWLRRYREGGVAGLQPKPKGRAPMKKSRLPKKDKLDHLKNKDELLDELMYLRAEMAVLKKLDALIREEQALHNAQKSSQD